MCVFVCVYLCFSSAEIIIFNHPCMTVLECKKKILSHHGQLKSPKEDRAKKGTYFWGGMYQLRGKQCFLAVLDHIHPNHQMGFFSIRVRTQNQHFCFDTQSKPKILKLTLPADQTHPPTYPLLKTHQPSPPGTCGHTGVQQIYASNFLG